MTYEDEIFSQLELQRQAMRYAKRQMWQAFLAVVLIVAGLLLIAYQIAHAASAIPAGCTSSIQPGQEPEVRCDVLWLPLIWSGK